VAAEEMECDVDLIYDAGAAGSHRLFPDLSKLIEIGVDAIVVAAGRDGTLPTVVSGLVPVLVVGLQVSVGALAARASAPLDAPVMFCTCGRQHRCRFCGRRVCSTGCEPCCESEEMWWEVLIFL